MMQAQSKFHEVRLSAQNHPKKEVDKMKLNAGILDQLIEEELQALLEQELTKTQQRANVAAGFSKSGHRTKAGQRSADAPHQTPPPAPKTPTPATPAPKASTPKTADKGGLYGTGTAFPPLVDPDWDKSRQATIGGAPGANRPEEPVKYKQRRNPLTGVGYGAPVATDPSKRGGAPKGGKVDTVANRILGVVPYWGGAEQALEISQDPLAGPWEKRARYLTQVGLEANPYRKFEKGHEIVTRIGDAEELRTGVDPYDEAVKNIFRTLSPAQFKPQTPEQLANLSGQLGYEVTNKNVRSRKVSNDLEALVRRKGAAGELKGQRFPGDQQAPVVRPGPDTHPSSWGKREWPRPRTAVGSQPPRREGEPSMAEKLRLARTGGYRPAEHDRPAKKKKARKQNESIQRVPRGRENMLTENQIKRFQKLADCGSPQKELITEAIDPILIFAVLGALVAGEVRSRINAEIRAKMYGTPEEEELSAGIWPTPITSTIKWVWKKLHGDAESRERKGDSRLASILNKVESEGEKSARRLSPESLAMIQEQFGDDEELAALLAQLGEVQEEEYGEVLDRVEGHIASKLGI
jgi:hypothetical protein